MKRLVPDVVTLGLDDLYDGLTLDAGDGVRAWIALGMVSSADGTAALAGKSGGLGGDADRRAFRALRAACDAVLVGAGTVRTEGYRPLRGSAARQDDRRRRGLAASPRLVIVSNRLDLDPSARVFSDPDHRPIVVTHTDAPHEKRRALASVAEIVDIGRGEVDLSGLTEWLAANELRRILCEGGPTLNGSLLERSLVDELFITLAPVAVGGRGSRIAVGGGEAAQELVLTSVHQHGHELLLRYRVQR